MFNEGTMIISTTKLVVMKRVNTVGTISAIMAPSASVMMKKCAIIQKVELFKLIVSSWSVATNTELHGILMLQLEQP